MTITVENLAAALASADPDRAGAHNASSWPRDGCRRFRAVPTALGELRYERCGGWVMDRFSLAGEVFRPIDLVPDAVYRGVSGTVIEALGEVMSRVETLVLDGSIPQRLDLDAAGGDGFVAHGLPERLARP